MSQRSQVRGLATELLTVTQQVATQINPEVSEVGASEFKRVMDINVFGTFLVTRAISGVMQRQEPMPTELPERGATRGVIVNMGSLASFLPSPGMLAYTASKHAVLGLTRNAGEGPFGALNHC